MTAKFKLAIALIAGIVVALGGALLMRNSSADAATCTNNGAQPHSYNVMIMDNHVEPAITNGRRCDTVTITNMDNVSREIAFGPHEDHVPYDGVAEKVLNLGQSFTITLNKTGDVDFHDHLHDEVAGQIVVTQ